MADHHDAVGPTDDLDAGPTEDIDTVRTMRCLIVDDESPARDELRFLLDNCAGVEVVGSAATAEEALPLIDHVDYDIVFLDIRMPGMGGLELASRLQGRPGGPQVIFTTAYREHAVDAFELSAADYLLKPLSPERLAEAVERARSRSTGRRAEASSADGAPNAGYARIQSSPGRPAQHTATTTGPVPVPARLPVQRGDRTVFVDEADIVAAAAAHGYSYLHLQSERVLVNYSLTELEQRLSDSFFRVHRSYLANLDRLVELRPDFKGALVMVMNDTDRTRIPVSRRQAQELRRRLGL